MKQRLLLVAFATVVGFTTANAQQGGGQRLTPEERTKATMEKLAVLNLDTDAKAKTETVIADYNNSFSKAVEEMRASGNMDRDAMMAKRKELAEVRDSKLKTIFTPEQMKKWTEEIEPSLRPQRNIQRTQ